MIRKYHTNKTGLAGEFRVMSELLLRGHNPAKSYLEDGADIILQNGTRIEVKSAHLKPITNSPNYGFTFQDGHQRPSSKLGRFDFAICWCIEDDVFFIIPSAVIFKSGKFGFGVSSLRSYSGKYASYKGNWDLLSEETKDGTSTSKSKE